MLYSDNEILYGCLMSKGFLFMIIWKDIGKWKKNAEKKVYNSICVNFYEIV